MTNTGMQSRKKKPSGASWKEWTLFFLIGVAGSVGLGLRYLDYEKAARDEQAAAGRLEQLREIQARKEKALRRMNLDKGREAEIRKRGWLKPRERPLPSVEPGDLSPPGQDFHSDSARPGP